MLYGALHTVFIRWTTGKLAKGEELRSIFQLSSFPDALFDYSFQFLALFFYYYFVFFPELCRKLDQRSVAVRDPSIIKIN